MGTRLQLYDILKTYCPNVYYNAPSSGLVYPCIMYTKSGKNNLYGNNVIYSSKQEYQLTVIDQSADSTIAERLENDLEYCSIDQQYVADRLNHTTLNLYF